MNKIILKLIYVFFISFVILGTFSIKTESVRGKDNIFYRVVVDRIEERYVICEKDNGDIVNFLMNSLPEGAIEGDVIRIYKGKMVIDKAETSKRKKVINSLVERLWK